MSKLVEVNEKIAEAVVEGYKKIEDGVVGGYKKIEDGVVEGFNKVSDVCIEKLFSKDGETVEETKERLFTFASVCKYIFWNTVFTFKCYFCMYLIIYINY